MTANRQRGAALLVSLWISALLAVIASSALLKARGEALRARQQVQRVQARHAADSGILVGILQLLMPDGARTAARLDVDGLEVSVSVKEEAGKVDVNNAGVELVTELLRVLGMPLNQARSLGLAIEERRRAAFNGHFVSVDELLQVVGRPTFDCMEPHVTAYTGNTMPDARYASDVVRRALWATGKTTANVLPAAVQPAVAGRVYAVRALVRRGGESWGGRRAVVRITGGTQPLFLTYQWTTTSEGDAAGVACTSLSAPVRGI